MIKWDDDVARQWLYNTAMDLIHDGLYYEGGRLIYYWKYKKSPITKKSLITICHNVLAYDEDAIEEVLQEVRALKLSAFS